MLAENQFYGISDEEIRKFLEDFFVRPTVSNEAVRPKLDVKFVRQFGQSVKDIHAQFMQITRPEELFRLRLRIVLRDELSFRQVMSDLASVPALERAKKLLEGATLEADAASSALLVGSDQPKLDWETLATMQARYNSEAW